MIGELVERNPEFIKHKEEFDNALEQFKDDFKMCDAFRVPATDMVTIATDLSFKEGFHIGMKFILDALAGKEVIEV